MIKTLKELSEAERQIRRLKYPSIPESALSYTKFSDKTANGLTRAIVAWFNISNGQAERISVTGRRIDCTKTFVDVVGKTRQIGTTQWIKPSMKVGTADISALYKLNETDRIATAFRIEVKVGRDTQRPAQVEYQKEVERAGGIYIIATSFENFITQMIDARTQATRPLR
jgi:hypothetical protein